ncbi:uncharacterized protein L201_005887 [Kwoniella dendrophila CBS 6074]|uniref:F-box domain-containing protein n=1 Tax=Kwoniella dendrophila CBS 6074 TaxID=1295534 RepID=A0AAX4K199_9TREE
MASQSPSLASRVWSLPHIRSKVLNELETHDLWSMLVLSKGYFSEVVSVMFCSIVLRDHMRLKKGCRSIERLRRYTSAVQYLETLIPLISMGGGPDLFSEFPNLKLAKYTGDSYDEDSLELNNEPEDSNSGISSFIYWRDYELSPLKAVDFEYGERETFPFGWEFQVRSTCVKVRDEHTPQHETDLTPRQIVTLLIEAWMDGKGIFTQFIEKLVIEAQITRREEREIGSIEEVKVEEGADEEEEENVIEVLDDKRVVEILSPLCEELELHLHNDSTLYPDYTLHDLLCGSTPIKWSIENKLKDLSLTLAVTEDYAPYRLPNISSSISNKNNNFNDSRCNLEYLELILYPPIASETPPNWTFTNYLPSISFFAKALHFQFGLVSTSQICELDITVKQWGSRKEEKLSESLADLLNKELKEIQLELQTQSSGNPGWKKLGRNEMNNIA